MWLVTPDGFYSVVAPEPNDPFYKAFGLKGDLVIRARSMEDLNRLRELWLPEMSEPVSTPYRDYACRAFASPDEVAMAMGRLVKAITYTNFKDEVKHRQGQERARIYGYVWGELLEIQIPRRPESWEWEGDPFPPTDIAESYPELWGEGDMGL